MPASPSFETALVQFANDSEPWFRDKLRTLVGLRTVSPGGENIDEIRAAAEIARDLMVECGARAEVVECGGTPAILGRFTHPQPALELLIYNHFDVQPADGDAWTQPDPFDLVVAPDPVKGFVYRGRGATDDKGPALCGLRAASFIAQQGMPIDISFVWETEEEIGSAHFPEIVAKRREQMACDAVIVSDTIWPSARQPALSVGLRGMLAAVLTLRTARQEVHSGIAGGVARNPVRELCRVATLIEQASFWRTGIVPPTAQELEGLRTCGFDPAYFRAAHQLEKLETELPEEMMIRLGFRPTFEIHALTGGYQGRGVKTSIPGSAQLKISFRLVPPQVPIDIEAGLRQFIAHVNPDVDVEVHAHLTPFHGVQAGPVHDALVEAVLRTFGSKPVLMREGGAIGAVVTLQQMLGVPVHMLALSLPEHGYHAPNECFDWRQARGGIEAFARTFAILAGGAHVHS